MQYVKVKRDGLLCKQLLGILFQVADIRLLKIHKMHKLPYFPAYSVRVIYTKKIWNRKKMNVRGIR
jgi:hypothetical protein